MSAGSGFKKIKRAYAADSDLLEFDTNTATVSDAVLGDGAAAGFVLSTNADGTRDWIDPGTSNHFQTLILDDDDESHGVTLQAPAILAANYTLTFPADDGTANQLLITDGSGVLSWTSSPHAQTVLFDDDDASHAVTVQAPSALAGNWTLTLPTNDGDAGQFLQTDGSGVTSWATVSGGSDPTFDTLTLTENDGAGNNTVTLHAASSFSANFDLYLPVDAGKNQQVLKVTGTTGTLAWDYRDDHGDAYWLCGTTPERWYQLPKPAFGTAPTTKALVADTLYAAPFFIGGGSLNLDKISLDVSTLGVAGTKARCGIYDNTNRFAPYPINLLVDSGEFAVGAGDGTGYKTTTGLDIDLPPGLYWAVLQASAAVTVRAQSGSQLLGAFLGAPTTVISTANLGMGYQIADTYGALPATFPGDPSTATIMTPVTNTSVPIIAVHFTGETT